MVALVFGNIDVFLISFNNKGKFRKVMVINPETANILAKGLPA